MVFPIYCSFVGPYSTLCEFNVREVRNTVQYNAVQYNTTTNIQSWIKTQTTKIAIKAKKKRSQLTISWLLYCIAAVCIIQVFLCCWSLRVLLCRRAHHRLLVQRLTEHWIPIFITLLIDPLSQSAYRSLPTFLQKNKLCSLDTKKLVKIYDIPAPRLQGNAIVFFFSIARSTHPHLLTYEGINWHDSMKL